MLNSCFYPAFLAGAIVCMCIAIRSAMLHINYYKSCNFQSQKRAQKIAISTVMPTKSLVPYL